MQESRLCSNAHVLNQESLLKHTAKRRLRTSIQIKLKAENTLREYLLPSESTARHVRKRGGALSTAGRAAGSFRGTRWWPQREAVPRSGRAPRRAGAAGSSSSAGPGCSERRDSSEGARCEATRPHACGRCGAGRLPAGLCADVRGCAGPAERCGAALGRARCGEATGRARRGRTLSRSRTAGKRGGEGWAQRGVRSRRPAPLLSAGMRACLAHAHCARGGRAHSAALRLRWVRAGERQSAARPAPAEGPEAAGFRERLPGDPAFPAGAERSGAQRLSRPRRFPRTLCGTKRGSASGSYGRGCGGVNWCGYLMRCGPSGLP